MENLRGFLMITSATKSEVLVKVKGTTLVNRLDPFATSATAVKGIFEVINVSINYLG